MQVKSGRQFRSYVISWFLMILGLIFFIGGYFLHENTYQFHVRQIIDSKLQQALTLSALIDNQKHASLNSPYVVKKDYYKELQHTFLKLSATQILPDTFSTFNYVESERAINYGVDLKQAPRDIIQINSPVINIEIAFDENQHLKIWHKGMLVEQFEQKINKEIYHVTLKKEESTRLIVNETEIFSTLNSIENSAPKNQRILVSGESLNLNDSSSHFKKYKFNIGTITEFQFRYVLKGEKYHLPGSYLSQNHHLFETMKKVIVSDAVEVVQHLEEDAKIGLEIFMPITDKQKNLTSILLLEVSALEVSAVWTKFLQSVIFQLSFIIIVLLLAAIFFARKITRPLEQLHFAIARLISNDFNFKLSTKGFGNFAFLAEQFNLMLTRIHKSRSELINLNKAYSRFVPHQLLKQLSDTGVSNIALGDCCEREMTVLFCDIRGFTTLSETMSPEANFRFINRYLNQIAPVINKQGGIIDKYLGDGIMAIFPKGADSALKAAIEMLNALEKYNKKLQEKRLPPIKVGLGLHSGKMMLGTVGTQSRMDATVVSDTVNAAARVESMTKVFRTKILITEETKRQLENLNEYDIRFIATCRIKGKSNQVTLYEVFDNDPISLRKEKSGNQKGMILAWKKYRQGDPHMAVHMYQQLIEKSPNDKSLFALIECCQKGRL